MNAKEVCKSLWYASAHEHDADNAGWLGKDWDEFERLIKNNDSVETTVEEMEAVFAEMAGVYAVDDLLDRYLRNPKKFTGDDSIYNVILSTLEARRRRLNQSEQPHLPGTYQSYTKPGRVGLSPVPKTIDELTRMLRDEGHDELADNIEADRIRDASGKVYESIAPDIRRILGESAYSTDDVAALYVEEGLGRFDWVNNWASLPDKRASLSEWCQRWHPDADVDKVFNLIELWAEQKFKFQ